MKYIWLNRQWSSSWQPDLQQYINACHICGDIDRVDSGGLSEWYAKHGTNHFNTEEEK
jgi:hypothetical protein